jgi:DNA-binding CsgD family transcriptional regulator
MVADTALQALIARAYDTALDARLWPALAPEVARQFGSSSCAIQVRKPVLGAVDRLSQTANYGDAETNDYRRYYWKLDLWAERAAKLGMSKMMHSGELISDAALLRTEFYSDWLRRIGIFHAVGAAFRVGAGEISVLGIHRARRDGGYGESDKREVGRFLPHLRRALQVRRRLLTAELGGSASLDGLARTGTATLVAERDGRILFANALAEALLAEADGIAARMGRLVPARHSLAERLARLIAVAADTAGGKAGESGGMLLLPRLGRLPPSLLVAPFPPARAGFGGPTPAAIVFIREPERAAPRADLLRSLFGFTPAEAVIAQALGAGQSLQAIAAANGVSVHTARTQLRAILGKTGTSRQAELVALLHLSVAGMGGATH